MSKKKIKIMKSIIAVVIAISINSCCLMQAYALPEPSPDWWQAATVIVGGAAANGTAVVSAPVVIGSVIVALGVCAGAWAVTHPDEFSEVVEGVKSRIGSLLVGEGGSGMMVNIDDGVPYVDESTLEQIAQALHDGGYLASSDGWSPSDDTSTGQTYVADSFASLTEVFDSICSQFKSMYNADIRYGAEALNHVYNRFPFLQNGNHFIALQWNVWFDTRLHGYIYMTALENQNTISFPFTSNLNIALYFGKGYGLDYYNINEFGNYFHNVTWDCPGLTYDVTPQPHLPADSQCGAFTNINGSTGGYGTTDNVVQVDGDTVTIPEWAGDLKESIDDLGNSIKNYPIALPSGTAIPYIFPDTTPEADIKTMVQDVPIPEDKPIPDIAEEGRTQEEVQNPDPDKPIEKLPEEPLTESTLPSLKLPAALAQRFPFSLVSDINVLVAKLSGTGEAPHFSIPVKIDIANIDTSIDVDLSMFSGAVSVIRPVILACAVLGIIRLTFKVINV